MIRYAGPVDLGRALEARLKTQADRCGSDLGRLLPSWKADCPTLAEGLTQAGADLTDGLCPLRGFWARARETAQVG
ncbi:hypothetical protein SAMN05444920_113246 [Nonomuraea solani]|uniref:Uncharacterized protein n=1 Tax=Nonomuraea solani TaxID=1144553 RepID=A0A1H6EP53_9ACTN|nr:hypothetical protein [Nonomuraea solani]SEG99650.1 hypothetical protein SAMN05444920_113246 [Nonomuraea solani]